ncbi:MAG: Jag N-terminal domain-containing protein [Sulfurimonas sp.]
MKTRMIKIEADTLEKAYQDAAASLKCSVTELVTEVVQLPKTGYFGFLKKPAIIVAIRDNKKSIIQEYEEPKEITPKIEKEIAKVEIKKEIKVKPKPEVKKEEKKEPKENKISKTLKVKKVKSALSSILHHTIMPASLTSSQDEDVDELKNGLDFTADYDDKYDEEQDMSHINEVVKSVNKEINELFELTCFEIDKIAVSAYDEETILIEFNGEDAALLIGKEGYRYKAISYMLFNWINSKYKVQLRLEIAEFLQNQEESVFRYIESVCESIDRDGKVQTKILDGVLVQIALKELRQKYPEKYIVIRSTKDGLKYIIVNDYHSN